ncbi:uncharacterized protein DS421_7g207650 [Arachis hypogaea]|nr:uncharacterized protein DS421_7g207650 [Arachis hypogaea]
MEQQLLGYEDMMYRLDHAEHIAGRPDRVAPRILRTRRNLMTRPPKQIRPYLRRAEFEYVTYMIEFEHNWPLALVLIERWRPEFHTFHLPCGDMTITLQDQHQQGRTIEELCQQILGVVPGPEDRQSQTKWTVKLTWFHNTICGELEQDATKERLLRYTRRYIMQLIGDILFPDTSDSWDLETCGQLSWGSAVLAWLYRQMWVQYRPDNARDESRLRHYRRTLNGIRMLNVEWTAYANPQLIGLVPPAIAQAEASAAVVCPLLCFAIVEWHQAGWSVQAKRVVLAAAWWLA